MTRFEMVVVVVAGSQENFHVGEKRISTDNFFSRVSSF